jgi:tryptophanyl-tRNA synthetase
MKTVFSGIQPSGNLHIGNYIGAINQWVKIQEDRDAIFCIVDLHAITVPQDPKILRQKVLETAALYIACGIDPKKAHLFIQSENPDHPYLAWLLNCVTSMGQLNRMTQFKDKSRKAQSLLDIRNNARREFEAENISTVGLFDYPVLMAADILLYQTDEVPVGEDQKQHIELTRDLAEKFNSRFGETFKLPNPVISKETARIMSLQNPASKMSKSDKDPLGTINLLDDEATVFNKVKRAITDSGSEIVFGSDKPAISNLLTIYSVFSGEAISKLEEKYREKKYSDLKNDLAIAINSTLETIRNNYNKIRSDDKILRQVLDEGREYIKTKSAQTLKIVKEKMGLI